MYNGEKWVKQKMESHPWVEGLGVIVDGPGDRSLGFPAPAEVQVVVVCGVADTGAQMTVMSPDLVRRIGVRDDEMIPIKMNITAANGIPLEILCGILVKLSLNPNIGGSSIGLCRSWGKPTLCK